MSAEGAGESASPGQDTLSFRSGYALGVDAGMVIAQLGPAPHPDAPESLIMEWTEESGWTSQRIALTARRMWVFSEPRKQSIIMGEGGYLLVLSDGTIREEMVDQSDDGPRYRGNMRDLRFIGGHLYAAGMNRQVYRREAPGRWVHWDEGVVQPLGTLKVSGFSAIDGLAESDIYASGFNGEIWHYDGKTWRQIDSPTNLVLHRIRVIRPDLVFACGQEGVLLQGAGDTWRPVEHDVTTENLWGMEWFNGSLYVSGDRAIYRLSNDQVEVVDTGLGESFTYRHLHANNGAMWSFGPRHVAKTDGRSWTNVTPQNS